MKINKAVLLIFCLTASVVFAQDEKQPSIKHEPVKAAIKSQPLIIRATVTDDTAEIKHVRLFCAASKDAAPAKIIMQNSGSGAYFGQVPDSMLKSSDAISYYIEALNVNGITTETQWYTVSLKAPAVAPVNNAAAGGTEKSYKKPLLIAGGLALAAGGAAIAASGGGGGDSSGTPAGDSAGSYVGSAQKFLQVGGTNITSESYLTTITILSNGKVTSEDLHAGTHMEANLNGSDFVLSANVDQTDYTGVVRYSGTVLGGRITGTISGNVAFTNGTSGTYSGIFSALKQ